MTELVTTLTVIFFTASVLLLLVNRRHSFIPAYIVAGLLIGRFIPASDILGLAELGIAFLVFLFGIRVEPGRIRSVAEESFATTLVQVTVVGTAAFLAARGLSLAPVESFYVALAASLSSSIVGLQLIEDEVEIQLLHGRLAESINLVQDLVAVAFILAVPLGSFNSIFSGIGLIAAALVFRSLIFPVLMRNSGGTETTLLTGLAALTVFAGVSQLLGISIVVGSFAAGLACARFPFNLEMLETLNPLKDFFSTIFFVTLGALVTFPSPETVVLTAIIFVATVALKPAITILMLLVNGYDRRTSYLTALTLDQVSEFALMIVITGFTAGIVSPGVFNAVILAAAATMVTSSYTTRHEESIYSFFSHLSRVESSPRQIEQRTKVPEVLSDHVILVGY
ncbi:MAG: cation:proton antiporter, partial [Candidatus Nanohaloarchaea archaeon]